MLAAPHPPDAPNASPPAAKRWLAPAVAMVTLSVYVALLLARVPGWLGGGLGEAWQQWIHERIQPLWEWPGVERVTWLHRHGLYLVVVGLAVPWLLAAGVGAGRPRDLGLRVPNRLGLRLVGCGLVLSLPLLGWMVQSPGIAEHYVGQFRPKAAPALLYYAVNMSVEHILLQGLLLAMFRPGLRWPPPPLVALGGSTRAQRMLRWLGLAQPTEGLIGAARLRAWLGLPPDCVPAVLLSGLLFGAVHLGKDPRELLLSFPGGVVSAYLAYRTNSLLTPFLLHLLTALASLGMMIAIARPA